jgi:hypothetical protein
MELPPLLTYAGSWVAITGGIWVLFQRAETVLKPEVKAAISQWLQNLNPATAFANWPATFAAVFDRIFGKRHLSWRCFGRSCIASFVGVITLILIWAGLRPNQFAAVVEGGEHWWLLTIFGGTVVYNLIPDYLSLLESRFVIHWMSEARFILRILTFLAIDLVFTAAIFWGVFYALFALLFLLGGEPTLVIVPIWVVCAWLSLTADFAGVPPPAIFFYSTFFTSVWVWLYAGCCAVCAIIRITRWLVIGIVFATIKRHGRGEQTTL